MSTTLTIRNLDEAVKDKLRMRGARHQRSMEAEARQILTWAVNEPEPLPPPRTPEEMLEQLADVRGLWKDRGTTDDLMALTRSTD